MRKFFIGISTLFMFLVIFHFPSYGEDLEKNDMVFFIMIEEQLKRISEVSIEASKEYIVLDNGEDYIITSSDIEILSRIVEAECSDESYNGKTAVANVVLNRVKSRGFPNTVEGVVFQESNGVWQFSPLYDGRYWKVEVVEETIMAVNEVIYDNTNNVGGSLFFMARRYVSSSSNVSWFDSLEKVTEIGGHEFFK